MVIREKEEEEEEEEICVKAHFVQDMCFTDCINELNFFSFQMENLICFIMQMSYLLQCYVNIFGSKTTTTE